MTEGLLFSTRRFAISWFCYIFIIDVADIAAADYAAATFRRSLRERHFATFATFSTLRHHTTLPDDIAVSIRHDERHIFLFLLQYFIEAIFIVASSRHDIDARHISMSLRHATAAAAMPHAAFIIFVTYAAAYASRSHR